MHINYHIGPHDGGFAYRLDDVWSEPFNTHDDALTAARIAAQRQQIAGRDTEIAFETTDGEWHREYSLGTDRPETEVVDG